ncbi:MAG: phosphopantetheine-binding protein [Microthrixaceae bacterium]
MTQPSIAAAHDQADHDQADVIEVVAQLVGEVIGEDYVADIDIGGDTSFSDDLEMESIEFVALAEALQLRFGERVDFVAWLAELELDDLIEMTVGRVAAFIAECLAQPVPSPQADGDAAP